MRRGWKTFWRINISEEENVKAFNGARPPRNKNFLSKSKEFEIRKAGENLQVAFNFRYLRNLNLSHVCSSPLTSTTRMFAKTMTGQSDIRSDNVY